MSVTEISPVDYRAELQSKTTSLIQNTYTKFESFQMTKREAIETLKAVFWLTSGLVSEELTEILTVLIKELEGSKGFTTYIRTFVNKEGDLAQINLDTANSRMTVSRGYDFKSGRHKQVEPYSFSDPMDLKKKFNSTIKTLSSQGYKAC